jgi:hypothetical protein
MEIDSITLKKISRRIITEVVNNLVPLEPSVKAISQIILDELKEIKTTAQAA